jgi:MFS transporter, DHA1 family, multidrug resistance protein
MLPHPSADGPWLNRRTPPHIVTLVVLAGVSALNMNMVLPSLPSLAAHYGAEYGVVALAISAYLGVTAVLQLFLGPLSDRFGRRPVVLVSLAVFCAATVGCIFAPTVGIFLFFRMVQAVVATGIVLSRAIVRDMVPPNAAASMIGYVTMGMAVAPMIAPTIGGVLEALYGWRAAFAFLTAFGGLTLLVASRHLHETNRNRGSAESAGQLLHGYVRLSRSRPFWGYALTTGFSSAVFFAFIAGASYVMVDLMRRSPVEYGFYFAAVPGGYILGNFLSGRFVLRFGPNRMILAGTLVPPVAVAAMAAAFAADFMHPIALFAPMAFVGLGNGLVIPSGIAGAVSVNPDVAGAAAGLSGSLQIGFGALVAPLVGAMLGTTVWPLIIVMTVCALLAIASFASFALVADRRKIGA